jgi:predicted O-linked N-acetylglucosamine transferase (SPINDLY family)
VGTTFPGRVAASLLNAIGVTELITHSAEEYEALATALALNPSRLQNLRKKIAEKRLTAPLFDTTLFTRHMEAAYEAMYRRHQAGLPPDHIEVEAAKSLR